MVIRTWSSSTKRIGTAMAVVLFGLLVPSAARADVERIAVHYETSGACPSEPDFLSTVRSYTTRWSHVPEGESASRTIAVRISVGSNETTGTLAVANASGTLSERTIVGPSCSEVSHALAVMVAVTIDPRAGKAMTPSATPPFEPAIPDREATPIEPTPTHVAASSERVPPARPSPPPPSTSKLPRVSMDLRVETTSGVLRGGLHGIGASMSIAVPDTIESRWLRTLKPSLGVGIRQSFPKERSFRGGTVDLSWTAGNVRLCPVRFSVASLVEVAPCAEANIGVVRANAEGFAVSRRLSSTWFDVGGSVWAAIPLSERIYFSSTMLVTQPMVRQPIALSSGVPVASVPPLGVLVGLGLGVKM